MSMPHCRGCGWQINTIRREDGRVVPDPDRRFYCRDCDPKGEREARAAGTWCAKCAAHYEDSGVCDEGKPPSSPHRHA